MFNSIPKISIIIPVYNNENDLDICLKLIENQDYPKEHFNVFVVDNCSTDNTPKIAEKYEFVTLLFEKEIQSSYAARNKALAIVTGDIIVFTDADCRPVESWLSSGVKCLVETGSDMIAGHVEFTYTNRKSVIERFDALYHMYQEATVECGMIATANLFVRQDCARSLGLFKSNLISGGDADWTNRAYKLGMKMTFCKDAMVYHPTRNSLKANLKKQFRLGMGNGQRMVLNRVKFPIMKTLLLSPFHLLRFIWPAIKYSLTGRAKPFEFILLVPVAKLMFFQKTRGCLSYLSKKHI